jgi:hypothetical protein
MVSNENLELTIQENIDSISSSIQFVRNTINQIDFSANILNIHTLVENLNDKIIEIIKMYNDVSELQFKVNLNKQIINQITQV